MFPRGTFRIPLLDGVSGEGLGGYNHPTTRSPETSKKKIPIIQKTNIVLLHVLLKTVRFFLFNNPLISIEIVKLLNESNY